VTLDPKYESAVGHTENQVIGLVYGVREQRPHTDVFQLVTDSDGNVSGLNFIKTYTSHLKVLIGRGNKIVCDTEVLVKSCSKNQWLAYSKLDIKNYLSACFIDNEDILYGLDNYSKVVHFKYQPSNNSGNHYIRTSSGGILRTLLKFLTVEQL
jgi:hypothetical protein